MAAICKIGNRFRAQIRRKGVPSLCQSFNTEEEARGWASAMESRTQAASKDADIYGLPRSPIRGQVGIYFLFWLGDCVYVGQSRKIHARVLEHVRRIRFDEYAFMHCNASELNALEDHYIKLLKPLFNIKGSARLSGT